MKIKTTHKRVSTTVLISMTDVIFLLLIFLLITSNYSLQTGLPFKLPGSQSAVRQSNQAISIEYNGGKTIIVNGSKIKYTDLYETLKSMYHSDTQTVKILTGKDIAIQTVIDVMDEVRSAGFEKVFIATEKKSSRL